MTGVCALAAYVSWSSSGNIICTVQQKARADMACIATSLQVFQGVTGRLPNDDEGLGVLTQPIVIRDEPRPLLSELPRDPWGRPYQYRFAPQTQQGYILLSRGSDPQSPADDVLFRRQ